jgi:hypothetical protein
MLRLISLLAVLAVAGATAATGFADSASGPIRVPVSFGPPVFRAAGEICSFPVEIAAVENREVATIFPTDANGDTRVIVTGYLLMQFTNLDTGKTFTTNVSGPGSITFHSDGTATVVLVGRSWTEQIPGSGDIPPGPANLLNAGRLILNSTATNHTIVDQQGRLQDVCALLT